MHIDKLFSTCVDLKINKNGKTVMFGVYFVAVRDSNGRLACGCKTSYVL